MTSNSPRPGKVPEVWPQFFIVWQQTPFLEVLISTLLMKRVNHSLSEVFNKVAYTKTTIPMHKYVALMQS